MTEQDTFDQLRRLPYKEMREIVRKFNQQSSTMESRPTLYKILEDNGWPMVEYYMYMHPKEPE